MKRACIKPGTNTNEQNASSIRPFKIYSVRMRKIKIILLFTGICCLNILQAKAQKDDFKVIGYFVNWYNTKEYARTFDYSKVTHINYAFVNVMSSKGDLNQPGSDLDTLVARAHANKVKVLASLGGGAQTANTIKWYNDLMLTDSLRRAFVHKFMIFLKRYQIDGWDIDLEGSLIKYGYYDEFIKALSDSLKPQGKLLTAALAGGGGDNFKNETIKYFDWINIMSYDFTGAWTPNSPGQHASYEHAVLGVTSWTARGAKKEQLIVGLPFYCHAFLKDISWDYKNYSDILLRFPYAYNQDTVGNIIYYNGIPTIKQKTCMAFEKAGGVMIWALQYDVKGDKSLLNAIDDVVKTYDSINTPPIVNITSPSADTLITVNYLDIVVNSKDTDNVFLKNVCYVNNVKMKELTNGTDTFKLANLSTGKYKIIIEGVDVQYKSSFDTIEITVNNSSNRKPFDGIPFQVPGKIEAEKYDVGGPDITFKDNSLTNSGNSFRADAVDIESTLDAGGGYSIGWSAASEWLEYSINVTDSNAYDIDFRVASSSSGTKLNVLVDGENVTGDITIANTGGWQTWKTVTAKNIKINKGEHILRLVFKTGNTNINYLNIKVYVPTEIATVKNTELEVFPNPAENYITLKSLDRKNNIEIYDSNGRLVLKDSNANNINISNLAKGIYHIKAISNTDVLRTSFVKIR